MKAFIKVSKDSVMLRVYAHQKVLNLLNSIPGKKFDADERVFKFPIGQQDDLVEGLLGLNITVQEVKEFPPQQDIPKIAYILPDEEMVEILIKYSPTVTIKLFFTSSISNVLII